MPSKRERLPLLAQGWDLLAMELTSWRWSWHSYLITSTLAPMLSMAALGVFARDSGPRALGYVLTGNAVLSLLFGNQEKVCSRFGFMRWAGTLDYFATLPIQRAMLVVAVVLSFLLLSLPSLVITLLAGAWLLHVPLAPHPLVLVVVPLCAVPLAGVGAIIGCYARQPQEAGSFSLMVTLVMAGLGPVVVPPERLPDFVVALGTLSPATWAASAMRQVLLGPLTPRLGLDVAVLVAFAALTLWLAARRMDWRQ